MMLDPEGLVEWRGTLASASGGVLVSGQTIDMYVVSDCIRGKRAVVFISQTLFGLDASSPFPVSIGSTPITLSDRYQTLNPEVFLRPMLMVGAETFFMSYGKVNFGYEEAYSAGAQLGFKTTLASISYYRSVSPPSEFKVRYESCDDWKRPPYGYCSGGGYDPEADLFQYIDPQFKYPVKYPWGWDPLPVDIRSLY
jgi:hypothetical protein